MKQVTRCYKLNSCCPIPSKNGHFVDFVAHVRRVPQEVRVYSKKRQAKENWNNMIIIRNRSKEWGRTWKDLLLFTFFHSTKPTCNPLCAGQCLSGGISHRPHELRLRHCGIAALRHCGITSTISAMSVHTQFSESSLPCLNPTGHLVAWYTACELLILFLISSNTFPLFVR